MRYIDSFGTKKAASQVMLGCMRIGGMSADDADRYIKTALELGFNCFDHADIYGGGECERVFGAALHRDPSLRERMIIQTKCGIREGMYDFSKKHIISSVDGSLKRLGTDRLDGLLLHRPDLLMDPDEVASAFDELEREGKVASFGVSNHSPLQIELLKSSVKQKICFNQLQLSAVNAGMIASGANVNTTNDDGIVRDGYVRDYCRLHGITVQAWSPLQHGFIEGAFLNDDRFEGVNSVIRAMADKYGVSDTGMAIAWLLRLPERMQVIVGSTSPKRLAQISEASDIELSREDWYRIYLAAGCKLP